MRMRPRPPARPYRPVAGGPFVLSFCLGMRLRFEGPVAFGAVARMVEPEAIAEASGTVNGVEHAPVDLIVSGGHMVIRDPAGT